MSEIFKPFIITSLTGLSNLLFFQTIINISSTLNIIPTKGMTLPLYLTEDHR